MHDEMTVDDAINVASVAMHWLADDADADMRQVLTAAARLVRHVHDQARELERERARRATPVRPESRLVDGHRLVDGADVGGRRDFLAGRAVHAGETLYLLTATGWQPVRYESNMPKGTPVLYLGLPGVQEDVVIPLPRDALLAWPAELR